MRRASVRDASCGAGRTTLSLKLTVPIHCSLVAYPSIVALLLLGLGLCCFYAMTTVVLSKLANSTAECGAYSHHSPRQYTV